MQDDKHPVDLDRFFAEAKTGMPEMPMALMAGILGDAADVSAARAVPQVLVERRGWLRALLAPIGGWPAMAAIAASAVIGVSAGYSGTDTLESLPGMGALVSSISDDPLDDFGFGYTDVFDDFLVEG